MTVQPISRALGRQEQEKPTAPPVGDVITVQQVGEKLFMLVDELEAAHRESVQAAYDFAEAEHEHELAFTTARINAALMDAKEGHKDAIARQSVAAKKKAMTLAQELRRSARDAEENLRQTISALQTLTAAVRTDAELAGKFNTDRTV